MKDLYYQPLAAYPVPNWSRPPRLLSVYPDDLASDALEMVHKVSEACGQKVIVNGEPASLALPSGGSALVAAMQERDVPYVLVYGLQPAELGARWMLKRYCWITYGASQYCFVDDAQKIAQDQVLKRRLWDALQVVRSTAA